MAVPARQKVVTTADLVTPAAHGWAAEPTSPLTIGLLDAAPTTPAFWRSRVGPHPNTPQWAEGTVAAPPGVTEIRWQRADVSLAPTVTVSPDIRGSVAVQGAGDAFEVRPGTHRPRLAVGPSDGEGAQR